jgi:ribosomal protein L11 methyltransferase
MLEMMPEHVPGRAVFDVGCGSGILTIAAAAMGAESVQAVDIDPDAVLHTSENISHNGFDKVAHAALAFMPRKNPLALMNMIWSEQKVAWPQASEFLTSGILAEQKPDYVSWIEEKGFTLLSILEQDGWCGFHFKY